MFIVLISSIIYTTGGIVLLITTFIVIFIMKTAKTNTEILSKKFIFICSIIFCNSASNNASTTEVFRPELTWRFFDMWTWFIVAILNVIIHMIVFAVTLHLYRFHVMLCKFLLDLFSFY